MKFKLLSFFFLAAPACTFAQDFEFHADTVSVSTGGADAFTAIYNKVKNISDRTYKFTWKLLNPDDLLPTWSYNGFCDNSICYTTMAPNGWYIGNPVESADLAPSAESDFKLQLNIPASAEDGTSIIKFEVKTDFQTDTAYFIATKSPTGISVIPVDDPRVSLYPNPTSDGRLNLFASKELGTKDIIITNTLGQIVSHITASDKEYQTIDIRNLSSSLYYVELYNASGIKLASRKLVIK